MAKIKEKNKAGGQISRPIIRALRLNRNWRNLLCLKVRGQGRLPGGGGNETEFREGGSNRLESRKKKGFKAEFPLEREEQPAGLHCD